MENGTDIPGDPGRAHHQLQALSELTYLLLQGVKICKRKRLSSSKSNSTNDNNVIKSDYINKSYWVKKFLRITFIR